MSSSNWRPTRFIRATITLHALALLSIVFWPERWLWALAAVVFNHILISLIGLWPRSSWLGPNWTELPAAAKARHEVALTIDDGPDPDVTPFVLDLLDAHAVKATFFCIGEKAARYPALCRDIVLRGHVVENHSQHHRHHFSLFGPSAIKRELEAAQRTLTEITGRRPLFFRAPAGLRNPFLEPVLCQLGLRLASWSVRGFDTRRGDAKLVSARLRKGLRAGAILLLHDGHCARSLSGTPVILEVLPELLPLAAKARLRWVTLPQALS